MYLLHVLYGCIIGTVAIIKSSLFLLSNPQGYDNNRPVLSLTWWRHEMETFSALLALCERNPPVTGGFPSQRPETRSFGVFFNLHLNKRLRKQSRSMWFGTPPCSLWGHCNETKHSKALTICLLLSMYCTHIITMYIHLVDFLQSAHIWHSTASWSVRYELTSDQRITFFSVAMLKHHVK